MGKIRQFKPLNLLSISANLFRPCRCPIQWIKQLRRSFNDPRPKNDTLEKEKVMETTLPISTMTQSLDKINLIKIYNILDPTVENSWKAPTLGLTLAWVYPIHSNYRKKTLIQSNICVTVLSQHCLRIREGRRVWF